MIFTKLENIFLEEFGLFWDLKNDENIEEISVENN